jgi:uncharacterized protein
MASSKQGATSGLTVAPGLILPADAVTQSFALLAVRRAGKSNAAAVLAEEMHRAGLPWVAIDPKGDWWGLRSSKDGTGPGLPVPVFGGLHGDVPLTPESGRLIAEIIVTENVTCILDVSDFPSKAAQMRFLTDFAEHLFRLHRKRPHPRHVFLEEADEYIPQRVMGEQAKCVGAWSKLVKQGGAFGLGVTLISQRSAVVNKDALTQVETLIALRTTSPQDRAAIKAWVDYHDASREIVDSLPSLEDGEAWVCSPHWLTRHGQPAVQRIRFRQRATFDSGATPTMATAAQRPATLADIDLGAILDRMEAVAEQAANDDPAALRKKIARLERSLADARRGGGGGAAELRREVDHLTAALEEARNRPPERVEVPVLAPGDIAALEQAITGMRDIAGGIELALSRAVRPAAASLPRPAPALPVAPRPAAVPPPAAAPVADVPLKPGALRVLETLARRHPLRVTRPQMAALAGMKRTGGAFQAYFSSLRGGGFIAEADGLISVTPAGLAATGADAGSGAATADDLREMWRGILKPKAWAVLGHLLAVYPETCTKAELAEAVGMTASGGAFQGYLTTLSTNDLVLASGAGVRAADVFFLAEAGSDV